MNTARHGVACLQSYILALRRWKRKIRQGNQARPSPSRPNKYTNKPKPNKKLSQPTVEVPSACVSNRLNWLPPESELSHGLTECSGLPFPQAWLSSFAWMTVDCQCLHVSLNTNCLPQFLLPLSFICCHLSFQVTL